MESVAPIPSQSATDALIEKIVIATGLLNGFWKALKFSRYGTMAKPHGTATIDKTPSNLFGIIRNKLNVGKKYHSGKISKGVANGSAGSPKGVGSKTARPMQQANVVRIQIGKIYSRSFGHAGSP